MPHSSISDRAGGGDAYRVGSSWWCTRSGYWSEGDGSGPTGKRHRSTGLYWTYSCKADRLTARRKGPYWRRGDVDLVLLELAGWWSNGPGRYKVHWTLRGILVHRRLDRLGGPTGPQDVGPQGFPGPGPLGGSLEQLDLWNNWSNCLDLGLLANGPQETGQGDTGPSGQLAHWANGPGRKSGPRGLDLGDVWSLGLKETGYKENWKWARRPQGPSGPTPALSYRSSRRKRHWTEG